MHRMLRAAVAVALSIVFSASAQTVQNKPLRMVAGMAAGGGADVNARRLSQALGKLLKQNVVIENIAGGAGNLAAQTVAGVGPDGNTLLFASHPILAINPILYEHLPFNPEQLTPVALVSHSPHILLVNQAVPATTLADFLRYAKSKPGAVNYGSGGTGTSIHLAGELLQSMTGISLVHVPYRGAGPAFTALLGNEIQCIFDSSLTSVGHVRGGRVRGLAVGSATRLTVLPDLPTFNESGVPGFESAVSHGILANAATPPERIAQLNRAINEVLADPDYRKQMAELGVVLVGGTPDQFAQYLGNERKKWGDVIRKRNIKVE